MSKKKAKSKKPKKAKKNNRKANEAPSVDQQFHQIAQVLMGLTIIAINVFQEVYGSEGKTSSDTAVTTGGSGATVEEEKSDRVDEGDTIGQQDLHLVNQSTIPNRNPSTAQGPTLIINNNVLVVNQGYNFAALRSTFPRDKMLWIINQGIALTQDDVTTFYSSGAYVNELTAAAPRVDEILVEYLMKHVKVDEQKANMLAITEGNEPPADVHRSIQDLRNEVRDIKDILTARGFTSIVLTCTINMLASIPIFFTAHTEKDKDWKIILNVTAICVASCGALLILHVFYKRFRKRDDVGLDGTSDEPIDDEDEEEKEGESVVVPIVMI